MLNYKAHKIERKANIFLKYHPAFGCAIHSMSLRINERESLIFELNVLKRSDIKAFDVASFFCENDFVLMYNIR